MRVNELAKKLGISADSIRYYTRAGFVVPGKDQTNGYRYIVNAMSNVFASF